MKKESLLILRCHGFGEAESFLLNSLEPCFGRENILVVADERSQNVETGEWQKTSLNRNRIYGCLFPLTRLSHAAIEHLVNERKNLTRLFNQKALNNEQWPNDEAFVSTTLQRDGFICQNLNSISNYFGSDYSLAPILWNAISHKSPVSRVLHPVLRITEHQRKIRQSLKTKAGKLVHGYLGNTIFPNSTSEASLDIALDALDILHQELQATLSASYSDISTEKLHKVNKIIQELKFLKKNVIKLHSIIRRHRKSEFHPARPENFILSKGCIIDQFDGNDFSPYAFDYSNHLFYLTKNTRCIEEKPFFYQAQFENASGVITLPLRIAEEAYGSYTTALRPTFVFSIGRCGSTLLSKLAQCLEMVNVSEPDIFTSFILQGSKIQAHEGDRLLFYTVKALQEFFGTPSPNMVIKLRAGCNRIYKEIYRNFPSANYIFVYRNILPWSKSFIQSFDWNNKQLFNTLVGFIDALYYFKQNQIPFHLLPYENLISNPREALNSLANKEISAIDGLLLDSILSKHSQTGTGLENAQISNRTAVEKRAQDFAAFWQQNKPMIKLKYLGIDL
jgi:hypothetical protein